MQQAKWMQLAAQQLQSELQRVGMSGSSWKATPAGHWSHQLQQEALTGGGAWDGHQRSHGEQHWAGDGVWDGHQQARREQQRADFELSNMHSQVQCLLPAAFTASFTAPMSAWLSESLPEWLPEWLSAWLSA